MMQVGFHPLENMWSLCPGFFHSVSCTVQNNLKLKTHNWLRFQPKCNNPMQLWVTVQRCAWKWVHCALFREWHNREYINRHEYRTCKHEFL